MRVREEVERGFDILSNAELKVGLAQMNATQFMKKQEAAWNRLNPNTSTTEQIIKGADTVVSNADSNIDFNANRFATRSKRLNTNLAKAPSQIPPPQPID